MYSVQEIEQIKKASKSFELLVSNEMSLEEMAEQLDEIMWQHTRYLLSDPTITGHIDNADPIYFLRQLRNVCMSKASPHWKELSVA